MDPSPSSRAVVNRRAPSAPQTTSAEPELPDVAVASTAQPSPAKRRRSANRLTDCCRTCRLRKVKCAGNPGQGPCINCTRLDLTCSFVDPNSTKWTSDKMTRSKPSQSHTEAGTLRKRAQRACSQCHLHKTRCSGDLPQCKRCETVGLSCEYTPARRNFSSVLNPSQLESGLHPQLQTPQVSQYNSESPSASDDAGGMASISSQLDGPNINTGAISANRNIDTIFPSLMETFNLPAEQMLARKNLILLHLDAYYTHLYWIPCLSFLHPRTMYQKTEDGTLDPALATAICTAASFFVNPGEAAREFGRKYADQLEFHLFRNMYNFDDRLLLEYALCVCFHFLDASFAKVWLLFGTWVRLMLALQVNWDSMPRNRSFAYAESLRRVAWYIFHMDRLLAGGYEEYISVRAENMKIRLPCNDAAFRDDRAVTSERLHDKPAKNGSDIGLHGIQIRLIDMRHRIRVTTKKLISPEAGRLEPSKFMADISSLQNELLRINASLPDDLTLNDQNITRNMAAKHRHGYVFLQTHMSQCHMELYLFAMPGMREKTPANVLRKLPREFLAKSQKQVVAHAICLARFCNVIQEEVDRLPLNVALGPAGDCTMGNMVTHCLRVLLIALEHNLYHDLADHTTAPLWRSEPADEASIRRLIDGLVRITEPWCESMTIIRKTHELNKKMIQDFDRTHTFQDQKRALGFMGPKSSTDSRLPGPHFILDNAQTFTERDEQRAKAGDAEAAAQWFGRQPEGSSLAEPVGNFGLSELEAEIHAGPPGIPMFLAMAEGIPQAPSETMKMYQTDDNLLVMLGKEWGKEWMAPQMDDMLAPNQQLMGASSLPLMHLKPPQDPNMFQQQPAQPQPGSEFIPPQQRMYMRGYPTQYPTDPTSTASYLPTPFT